MQREAARGNGGDSHAAAGEWKWARRQKSILDAREIGV